MPDRLDLFVARPKDVKKQLADVGPVDLIVGIPSYKEADSIAHVVSQADAGLREYFGDLRTVIVNADNDSPDGTQQAFLHAGSRTPLLYVSTPPGVKGKGNNFWNLFQVARELEAKAVVCVDADLISITPQWIRNLAAPILGGKADYITPIYARNEYDGTITNNICYPLIRGVLGTSLRQPIGGDFGLSTNFSNSLLEEEWADTTREYGIDIFLTTHALLGGYRLGQTRLGAKVHKPSAPKLGPMFTQVVTTLFESLAGNRRRWLGREADTKRVKIYDGLAEAPPQSLAVDYKAIKLRTLHQYQQSRPVLSRVLAPERFEAVDAMMEKRRMGVKADLWCQIVYDLFHAFATRRTRDRPPVVEALKPMFFARVASFYKETLELSHSESEAKILRQAELFRRQRPSLLERFGAKD